MRCLLSTSLLLSLIAIFSGCAMCASPFDNAYGFYGGSWQRDNLNCGRVGSAFQPAGAPILPPAAEEPIVAPDQPATVENPDQPKNELPPRRGPDTDAPAPEISSPANERSTSARRKSGAQLASARKSGSKRIRTVDEE